jgi:hypothetical protein
MERQAWEQRARGSGSSSTLLGSEFDTVRVNGHEREFSRDEEPVDENEKNDCEKTKRGVDTPILLCLGSSSAVRPRPPTPMAMLEFK